MLYAYRDRKDFDPTRLKLYSFIHHMLEWYIEIGLLPIESIKILRAPMFSAVKTEGARLSMSEAVNCWIILFLGIDLIFIEAENEFSDKIDAFC
jgi:hypothetical protein